MTKWMGKALLCLMFLGLVPPASLEAQSESDKNSISSFVDSVASTVYNLAWPTAKYRGARVDDITSVDGGYDVLATFWGLSGLDDSNLWVQLRIELRTADGLHDIHVVRDNHFWVPPFATTIAAGNALLEMQKQYQREHPTGTPKKAFTAPAPAAPRRELPSAAGACLANPTDETIIFFYRWGNEEWTKVTLEPDHLYRMAWSYGTLRSTPVLSVSYDCYFAPGYQEVTYDLDSLPVSDITDCSHMKNYHFGVVDTKILVYVER